MTPSDHHLSIVELAETCAAMRARSLDAFEQLGTWVASDAPAPPDAPLRRALSAATHRHARHAELWAARLPSIPGDTAEPASDRPIRFATDDSAAVVDAYTVWLDRLEADLVTLAGRFDPVLDPSTADTIALVRADIARISSEVAAAPATG